MSPVAESPGRAHWESLAGRDPSLHAFHHYTYWKTNWIDLE
jgi:hypothetical protein